MDFVSGLFFVLIALLVTAWILSALAKRHVVVRTALPRDQVAAVCDGKFSRLAWRRVDGKGDLNYQARGLAWKGITPPVMSIDIEPLDDGGTAVEFWMSAWTSQHGIVGHVEKVFWKRWTLPRAIQAAEAAHYGPAAVSANGPVSPVAAPSTSAGHRAAGADDGRTTLSDPGLPDGNLTQLSYEGFKACGLTVLSYGELPLHDHVRLLLEHAPAFRGTEVRPLGGGIIGGDDRNLWIGLQGPRGSVVAFYALGSDGDFVQHSVLKPMSALPSPVQWGIGTVGASVPAGAAHILSSAHAVPLWEVEPFTGQRPADELDIPPAIAADLALHGWERFTDNGFKTDVAVDAGGTLAVFFTPYDAHSFTLMAPIDKYAVVPEFVRTRTYAPPYVFDAVGDMAVLRRTYPARAPLPTAADLIADARALATYTHDQFSSAPTHPAAAPTQPLRSTTSYPPPSGSPVLGYPPPVPPTSGYAPPSANLVPPNYSPSQGPITPPYGTHPAAHGLPGNARAAAHRRSPLLLAGAALGVVALMLLAFSLMDSGGSSSPAPSSGGAIAPVRVDQVTACNSAPTFSPQSASLGPTGLSIGTRITPTCAGGDLLANSRLQVNVVDGSGRNVASGVFDTTSAPLTAASGGSTTTLIFPAGTYWRTPSSVDQLRMTVTREGADQTPSAGTVGASSVTAAGVGTPASGTVEDTAQSALTDLVASDRAAIDASLLDVWQPQLSSKRPGLVADGITWAASDILREHMQLRQRFPGARLLWSGDWPVFNAPIWWVTVAGVPFPSGEQANSWCDSQGFDTDHCFAKLLSHNQNSSGSTLMRR